MDQAVLHELDGLKKNALLGFAARAATAFLEAAHSGRVPCVPRGGAAAAARGEGGAGGAAHGQHQSAGTSNGGGCGGRVPASGEEDEARVVLLRMQKEGEVSSRGEGRQALNDASRPSRGLILLSPLLSFWISQGRSAWHRPSSKRSPALVPRWQGPLAPGTGGRPGATR